MYGIYDGTKILARFVTPMTIRSNHPVYASDTLNLGRQIVRRTAQRWEIETSLEPLSSTAQDLFVHLITSGYSTPISVITPQNYGGNLVKSATSAITASGTAGSNSVTIAGNDGFIPKGAFIKFNNSTKVYITTTDRSGDGGLAIYPALKVNMTNQAMTYKNDVIMTCFYDLDTLTGMSYSDGILMDIGTVKLVEAI